MSDSVHSEIISLIESDLMREHLLANQGKLRPSQYINIIAGAPVSLTRKRDLLARLGEVMADEAQRVVIADHLALLDKALGRLLHISPTQSSLIAVNLGCSDDGGYTEDDFFPVDSYHSARLAIRRWNEFELQDDPNEIPLWY